MKKEIFNPLKKYLDEIDEILFPNLQTKEVKSSQKENIDEDLFSLVKKLKNKRLAS